MRAPTTPSPPPVVQFIRHAVILGVGAALLFGEVASAAQRTLPVTSVPVVESAVVNMADLARWSAVVPWILGPRVPALAPDTLGDESDEAVVPPNAPGLPPPAKFDVGRNLELASPAPTKSFAGLDDIPMADSALVSIPPDVNGAVGPTAIFQNLKNNVRIQDKSTGAVLSTVGINTWWAATGAYPNRYSDPRTVYDPYHGRFITIILANGGYTFENSVCLGVSDGSDPSGTWHLYRFVAFENSTYTVVDFPTLGFNKNWITISTNMYSFLDSFGRKSVFMIHYPTLRDSARALVYRADNPVADLICGAPCVTYSATCDTEYVVQRQGTSTYSLDMITGAGPGAPTYVVGPALTRPGGEWNGLSSLANYLPQSAPMFGASACGSTPCTIERTDDHVRAPAVYRGGSIWFAQQVGLPASAPTYVAAQWTQITTPSGAFVVGGRLQDSLATFTNGRPHYSYPSISVNATGDFLLGFNRFSSSQYAGAGYAMHLAADGVGTLRDTVLYKDGEDYYRKSPPNNRNRWGDFSTSQVDPSDDMTLWTVQEYAKARIGTDDGPSASNSSRWGTWWAAVAPASTGVDTELPVALARLAVGPNPGHESATIRYTLPRPTDIRLTIHDLQGRAVMVLANGRREAGTYETVWRGDTRAGRALPGVYFVRLQTPAEVFAKRLVLTR